MDSRTRRAGAPRAKGDEDKKDSNARHGYAPLLSFVNVGKCPAHVLTLTSAAVLTDIC
jgi:hypothetical protein